MQIIIHHMKKDYYVPTVNASYQTNRKGSPGILNFTVIKTDNLRFSEGDPVRAIVKNKGIFFGFIFTKKRNKNGLIDVTAYDQLRYLKNKDTFIYNNKSAAELIKILAKKFNLRTGTIDDTRFKIASIISDNKTLFDVILESLEDTLLNTGKMYVMYDDFGKITLKDMSKMKIKELIDKEVAVDFDYTSTIDEKTYNKIQLVNDDNKKSGRPTVEVYNAASIGKWGVLQYTDKFKPNENARVKAEALLNLYNRKTRHLQVKGAFLGARVRAGNILPVMLDLGDMKVSNYMIIEKCKHSFKDGEHLVDLELIGGDFIA